MHNGRIGVLVEFEGADDVGKDVAMHISFSRPAYLAKSEVPADVVARERDILAARARESGKPAEIVAKMVDGGLNKFLAEATLLGQPFIKDDKQSVEKMLAAKKAKVLGFRFLVVGEGIEKAKDGFCRRSGGDGPLGIDFQNMKPKYKRILLKLSGEALMGEGSYGISRPTIEAIVAEIAGVARLGVEIGVVIGGGNIFRGVAPGAAGMDRATADYMGMLATVMNALALQDAMRQAGVASRVQSALNIEQVVEPYIRGKAIRYLEEGKIVIFAAGTGNPFFTTDTAAALRASEMGAEIVLKATKVDGVYTSDPNKDPDAKRYQRVSFDEAIQRNLKVMDATALALCRDQRLPVNVFSIFRSGALGRVVAGDDEGTLVHV